MLSCRRMPVRIAPTAKPTCLSRGAVAESGFPTQRVVNLSGLALRRRMAWRSLGAKNHSSKDITSLRPGKAEPAPPACRARRRLIWHRGRRIWLPAFRAFSILPGRGQNIIKARCRAENHGGRVYIVAGERQQGSQSVECYKFQTRPRAAPGCPCRLPLGQDGLRSRPNRSVCGNGHRRGACSGRGGRASPKLTAAHRAACAPRPAREAAPRRNPSLSSRCMPRPCPPCASRPPVPA